MKKFYAFFLSVLLSIPALMADDYVDPNGLKFYINLNTQKAGFSGISDEKKNDIVDLVIPDNISYNGKQYPVIEVLEKACQTNAKLNSIKFGNEMLRIGGQAFYSCSALRKVEFGQNIHVISSMAFYGCAALKNLQLPGNLDSMGDFAFYNCTGLSGTINIPATTQAIGYNPFARCTGITAFSVDANCKNFAAKDGVLFDKNITKLISYPLGLKDATNNFVTKYTVPSTVKTIGSNSMRNNARLESVVFNDGLEAIEDQAFNVCGLKEVNIPSSLTTLGDRVFTGSRDITFTVAGDNPSFCAKNGMLCTKDGKRLICGVNISNLTIPDGVESIDRYAFYYLFSISNLNLNGVKSVGEAAFYNVPSLKEVNFGSALEEIGDQAFRMCTQISKVEFPSTLRRIGNASFLMCYGIKSVKFNEGLEAIGNNAFQQNVSLEEVNIPSTVRTFGDAIFYSCSALQKATLAEGLTSTGSNMFTQCGNLFEVKLPSTLESIEKLTFLNTSNLEEINFPAKLKLIGEGAFQKSGIPGEIVLPDACEEIGHAAFTYCPNITAFTAGKGLRVIEDNGLGGNDNLVNINLNEGLVKLGSLALGHNQALKSVIIPSTVTTIGDYLFGETKNIIEIENRAVNPQPLTATLFFYNEQYSYVKLCVPAESVDKYKSADIWRAFRVIEGSAAGLNDIETSDAEIVEIYDLAGRRHENLVKGINIVKMSDGSVRKVISRD